MAGLLLLGVFLGDGFGEGGEFGCRSSEMLFEFGGYALLDNKF